ncbi:MAG TPA: hypothetical protein VFK57_13430 [Vicinamibacterales bacterium]|nr:hypothetical protein [Vicinamibacterales bacterium]
MRKTCGAPSAIGRLPPRHWTNRRLEPDASSGLFRDGLIGGLSYLHPAGPEQPCAYSALDVGARDLKCSGWRVTRCSWAWSAITLAAGAEAGIAALVLDGFVRVLDAQSTSIEALFAEQMRETERHLRGTTGGHDLAMCITDARALLQRVVEYVRIPSRSRLAPLLDRTAAMLTRLSAAGLAAYPGYLIILGIHLLLLQEQAGSGQTDAAQDLVARIQAGMDHHDGMVRRVQAETDPRLMVLSENVVRTTMASRRRLGAADAPYGYDDGVVVYYHYRQPAAGGELTGYTALRDGHWVRPEKLPPDLHSRCPDGAFIDWDARRLGLITTILGPATEVIALMRRATATPKVTLLRTRAQEGHANP